MEKKQLPAKGKREPELERQGKYCIFGEGDEGVPCVGFHMETSKYCAFHDDDNAKRMASLRILKKKVRAEAERGIIDAQQEDLTTHRGIARMGAALIKGLFADAVSRATASTAAYVLGIQIQAVKAAKEEANPNDSMEILLKGNGEVKINMTTAERKAFLQAGRVEKQLEIIEQVKNDGRIIDMTQTKDGSYSATVTAKPKPERDQRIPAKEIAKVLQEEENMDIKPKEVVELFGSHLGAAPEGPPAIGFDHLFTKAGLPQEAYHDCVMVQKPHPVLPNVKIGENTCKVCGQTVAMSKKYEICPGRKDVS